MNGQNEPSLKILERNFTSHAYKQAMKYILQCFSSNNMTVIWKTSPHASFSADASNLITTLTNERLTEFSRISREVCNIYNKNCIIADIEMLLPRSMRTTRIASDTAYHFGENGDLAAVQYLLHILFESC